MIRSGPDICRDLDSALQREWLETNGIGGFASSTIVGLNTRRYHGLLVAALHPPVGRYLLLSKLEETVTIDDRTYELSANQYPGTVQPRGFIYLKEFKLEPLPTFVYQLEELELRKTIFMAHGRNATVVQYVLSGRTSHAVSMKVHPLIAFRDFHALTHENPALSPEVHQKDGVAIVQPYASLPPLYIAHDAGSLITTGYWYRSFEYAVERARGLDFVEDLFDPFDLDFDLSARPSATVLASLEGITGANAATLRAAEIKRREALTANIPTGDEIRRRLAIAADQFVVARKERATVIAGYPWFGDWGRDTMIALPGLTLTSGRPEIAKSILLTFASLANQGMLPNRFPEAGEQPEYNTVDATLWFFEAIRALLAATDDEAFVRTNFYPVLSDVVEWHVRGTRFGIKVDSDGLLRAGEAGVQLTWMDAKIGECVVTPRTGKPVEIQALWYNALRIMEMLAEKFRDAAGRTRYAEMATQAQASFGTKFWYEAGGYLCDVVGDDGGPDASLRPNQVIALSLPFTMIDGDRGRRSLQAIEAKLLTPYGLRTLSPDDPQYRPNFEGDPSSRDSAYHQGTVWPWLMGPFAGAYLKVNGRTAASVAKVKDWLQPLCNYVMDRGVGSIPEVFDGDPPHAPGGCFAQAWSVAEVLRVSSELAAQPPKARSAGGRRPR